MRTRMVGIALAVVGLFGWGADASAQETAATEQLPPALQALGLGNDAVVSVGTARDLRGKAGFFSDFLAAGSGSGFFPDFLSATDVGGFFPNFLTARDGGSGFFPSFVVPKPSGSGFSPNFLMPRASGSGFSPDFLQPK